MKESVIPKDNDATVYKDWNVYTNKKGTNHVERVYRIENKEGNAVQ